MSLLLASSTRAKSSHCFISYYPFWVNSVSMASMASSFTASLFSLSSASASSLVAALTYLSFSSAAWAPIPSIIRASSAVTFSSILHAALAMAARICSSAEAAAKPASIGHATAQVHGLACLGVPTAILLLLLVGVTGTGLGVLDAGVPLPHLAGVGVGVVDLFRSCTPPISASL